MRPLGERALIRRLPPEDKTSGGIVLPDTAKEKPESGVVLALGPGKMLDNGTRAPIQVTVGDKVLFASYAGTNVKIDGDEYLLINESDILAIVN